MRGAGKGIRLGEGGEKDKRVTNLFCIFITCFTVLTKTLFKLLIQDVVKQQIVFFLLCGTCLLRSAVFPRDTRDMLLCSEALDFLN